MVKEMQEKALDQVLRVRRTVTEPPDECIEGKPVKLAQLGQRGV
jgi:hypothetical protein